MDIKAFNKGEWSEMYVFVKLLKHNRLCFGDASKRLTEDFIEVNSLTPNNSEIQIIRLSNSNLQILDLVKDECRGILEIETIINEEQLIQLRKSIENGNAPTFSEPSIYLEPILSSLNIKSFKGSSLSKGDFNISFTRQKYDIRYPSQAISVKSYLGKCKPTLVNASSHTKFQYVVTGLDSDIEVINEQLSDAKYKTKIQKLIDMGAQLRFVDVKEPVYKSNLVKVDSRMPELLGNVLLKYFSTKRKTKLSEFITDDVEVIHLKRFLLESMLGIFPSLNWDGRRTCNGSISLLKNDTLLLYHVLEQGVFEDYLFKNTRFDSPQSRGANDYCELYEKNGNIYIDLVLQVRFQ